jgi:hypothetical protein
MSLQALSTPRFIRKTRLGPGEYRKNFHQIDRDVLTVITSPEADRVTPLMSKIYLRLVNAPERFWEAEGVLRIESELRGGKIVKAWAVLCDLVGVASATASKAIAWMREQGIIGYFSGKNGVGLRIFLNRAVASVGVRRAQAGQKILAFAPASSEGAHASAGEPAFNDSFAVLKVSDSDINSRAPKNGADDKSACKNSPESTPRNPAAFRPDVAREDAAAQTHAALSLDDVAARLWAELEPAMLTAARQAAAREHERTREWLQNHGLPKAARVAQHEAYNVLKKHGMIDASARSSRSDVGRGVGAQSGPNPHSPEEVTELAGACVALLEVRGQSVELTLSEMSVEAGGFLLPGDAARVREKVQTLLASSGGREGERVG